MRILGLDLSTTKTGWAIFEDGKYTASGVIAPKDTNWTNRCLLIVQQLQQLGPFDLVVMEDIFQTRANPQVSIKLANLHGMIKWIFQDTAVITAQPSEWRSKIGIKTYRKKREQLKQDAIALAKKITGKEMTDDEAEAVAIGFSSQHFAAKNGVFVPKPR